MRTEARLPECIRTPNDLRVVVRRLEILSSVLRMSGHPVASLPPREEMSEAIELLTQYARKTYDPDFMRQFHAERVRQAG